MNHAFRPALLRPRSVRPLRAAVAALLLACALGTSARAQAPNPIDPIFAEWNSVASPGCAVGVVGEGRGHRLLYSKGYGTANLDYAIPNSPTMVFYVGSVSKQFTAASIALLVQDGTISLDDDVRKYVPELPAYDAPITIRHLVHHTSGLRDIYVLMDLAGIRMEDVLTDDDALALIARQNELNFTPGTDYLYSNSGYWLLGQIVERVTGESLREFARERIFEPLGMTDTHFHDDPGHPMKNRVVSYAPEGDGYRVALLQNFDKIGAGGLYTTVEDLAKWDANFEDPKVGGQAFLDLIHTRGVLASGDTLPYAFGLTIGEYRGRRTVRHGGSLMGYRAEFLRFPDENMAVIVLCNLGTINPGPLAERVAEVYLGNIMAPRAAAATRTEPARPTPELRPEPALLDALAGEFTSNEVQATYRLERTPDGVLLHRPLRDPARLRQTGPDTFRAGSLVLRFESDGAGGFRAFTVQAGRVSNIRFSRTR